MSEFFFKLSEFLDQLPVVSVHEHHRDDDFQRSLDLDKLLANTYVGWTGIPWGQTTDSRRAFLDQVQANSSFCWLERALQQIYSFADPLTAENWDWLSERIRQSRASDGGFHWSILRDRCRCQTAILDAYWAPGADNGRPDFYRPAYRVNMHVMCHHPDVTDHNGNNPWRQCGVDFGHIDEVVEWLDEKIGRLRSAGAVAVKAALAYDRTLEFDDPPRHEAMRVFRREPKKTTGEETRIYGDFMFNRICEACARHNVPLQVHTGLARIQGSAPMNLEPTIRRHPQTRFVLLHAGYPWPHQVAGLARTYRNVLPDMTWTPLISTSCAMAALTELLEATASCGSIAWGGDTWTAEETCAAVLAWKHVVASVLTHKVDCGLMTRERAYGLASKLIHENARSVYGIE